jgi:hypothetical protein
MENLKVVPNTLSEGRAMELMFDGFRKATRNGNSVVIVRNNDGASLIFRCEASAWVCDAAICNLHDDCGRIIATARMDKFDL